MSCSLKSWPRGFSWIPPNSEYSVTLYESLLWKTKGVLCMIYTIFFACFSILRVLPSSFSVVREFIWGIKFPKIFVFFTFLNSQKVLTNSLRSGHRKLGAFYRFLVSSPSSFSCHNQIWLFNSFFVYFIWSYFETWSGQSLKLSVGRYMNTFLCNFFSFIFWLITYLGQGVMWTNKCTFILNGTPAERNTVEYLFNSLEIRHCFLSRDSASKDRNKKKIYRFFFTVN